MEKSLKKRSKSKSPEKYIDKVGPKDSPEKYGLISKLGKGRYGKTYKARNLSRQQGEDEFYAVKIMILPSNPSNTSKTKVRKNWIKEVTCLKEVMEVCSDAGILCYKDSFIRNKNGSKDYIIVTPLLDGYVTLWKYLDAHHLTEEEAFEIYKKVVHAKNIMTDLCINHSDLHTDNIMIHPDTNDVKVIDLGRCQTPAEEVKEWKRPSKDWDEYSDEGRLKTLRQNLFENVFEIDLEDDIDNVYDDIEYNLMDAAPIKQSIPGCKRKDISLDEGEDEDNLFIEREKELMGMFSTLIKDINKLDTTEERTDLLHEFYKNILPYKDILDDEKNIDLKNVTLQRLLAFEKEDPSFRQYYDKLK